ncbi:MAG: glycosyltransferase family 2 protein [Candidatus Omnitrophota bacterium]
MLISFVIPVREYTRSGVDPLRCLCAEMRREGIDAEIIVVEGRAPSRQRNEGVLAAKGEIIYFLDDDVRITEEHFRVLLELYADDKVGAAGGPVTAPQGASLQERVFGGLFASFFGGCAVRYRHKAIGGLRPADENMLILANLSIRKKIFDSLCGGFREDLYPNEENELIVRLKQKGFGVFYAPELEAERTLRKTLPSFVRMCLRNGRGRADCIFANSATLRPFYLVPAFFVIYLLSLFWLKRPVFFLPVLLYLVLDVVFSAVIALRTANLPGIFISLLGFPCMHIFYGIGFLSALPGNLFRKIFRSVRGPAPGGISIIRLP